MSRRKRRKRSVYGEYPPITVEEFRDDVHSAASLLREHGFRHALHLDRVSGMGALIFYTGEHIAFVFDLDARDRAVGVGVERCRKGKILDTAQGGFSRDLYGFLVSYRGYRGGLLPVPPEASSGSRYRNQLLSEVNLLTLPCAEGLLEDRETALPEPKPAIPAKRRWFSFLSVFRR